MADFVHLHNHTDYSLLDAAQTVDVMCNRAYDLGMDSIAVTDHGNLFAMLPFYKEAQKIDEKIIQDMSLGEFLKSKNMSEHFVNFHICISIKNCHISIW